MNIRSKTLVVVAIALVISAVANFVVINFSVFPKFIELEREAANRDLQRVTEAVHSEIDNIEFTLWDYTNWDDTYQYVLNPDEKYPPSNLKPDSLKNIRMEIVQIVDTSHAMIYAGGYDKFAEDPTARNYDWHFKDLVELAYLDRLNENEAFA